MTGETAPLHDIATDDDALLMYTSGTTGQPKGVVHTQSSLLAGVTVSVAHKLTPKDRGMWVLPFYHINGLCVTVMGKALFPADQLPWSHDFQPANSGNRLMPEASRGFQLFLQLLVTYFIAGEPAQN